MTVYLSKELHKMLYDEQFGAIEMITLLRDCTNPNHSATTLWHGIDDCLNEIIPMFIDDNVNYDDVKKMISIGWKSRSNNFKETS